MKLLQNVSRRAFIRGIFPAGALVIGASLLPESLWACAITSHAGTGTVPRPNLFVGIQADDTVWIVASRSEMGTGTGTALPMILADELDADWTKVRIRQADGDPRYGNQDTDGSHSVRSFFDVMRRCGAAARMMLVEAAARQWKVRPAACETEPGVVLHRASGRRLTYGQLASTAAQLQVPDSAQLRLKSKAEWRYIGKDIPDYYLCRTMYWRAAVRHRSARRRNAVRVYRTAACVWRQSQDVSDDTAALRAAGVRKVVSIPPFCSAMRPSGTGRDRGAGRQLLGGASRPSATEHQMGHWSQRGL